MSFVVGLLFRSEKMKASAAISEGAGILQHVIFVGSPVVASRPSVPLYSYERFGKNDTRTHVSDTSQFMLAPLKPKTFRK